MGIFINLYEIPALMYEIVYICMLERVLTIYDAARAPITSPFVGWGVLLDRVGGLACRVGGL